MEVHERFYVLEKYVNYERVWYTKELQGRKQLNYVHNILHGDRYKTEEDALKNAPDDTWKPLFVNWFCSYTSD